MKARNDTTINRLPAFWLSGSFVFCGIWLLVWLLYLPATDAGFVGDFYKDWLRIIREESFWHHINRPGSFTVYQFTQLLTYGFYRLFGDYPPAWHILHVTMHAFCAVALYTFFRQLLRDSRLKSPEATSLIVTVLFAVSAYNSEVIVHEPCLHYTFGFLLLLLPLIWMQHYFNSQKPRYLWWAVLIFVPASYAIEVFYLTPWLILSLCIFYVYVLQRDKKVLKKSFLFLVLPSLLIFFAHILVLRAFTGTAASHQVSTSLLTLLEGYWNKVLKYVFHILFMGRFFSHDVRKLVYNYCQSGPVIILSHVLLIGAFAYYFAVASRTGKRYPLILLFSLWAMAFIALVSPREFPQGQLVSLDRYIYFMLPFMLMIVALCFSARCRSLGIFLFLAYFTVNIYLLLKVNRYWRDSNRVVESLYRSFPSPDGRITLLLNNPVNMQGVHMIGGQLPKRICTGL